MVAKEFMRSLSASVMVQDSQPYRKTVMTDTRNVLIFSGMGMSSLFQIFANLWKAENPMARFRVMSSELLRVEEPR